MVDYEKYPSAAVTVSFGEDSGGGSIQIELDEYKNEGKTEFAFGDTCWFRVIHDEEYELLSSFGDPSLFQKLWSREVEESVLFVNDDVASVSGEISTELLFTVKEFVGAGEVGIISILDEKQIKNSKGNLLGKLDISYITYYDLCKLINVQMPEGYDEEEDPGLEVIIVATDGENTGHLAVTFKIDPTKEESSGDSGESIRIELDRDSHTNYEDNDMSSSMKSRFAWGETAIFRVFLSDRSKPYTVESSIGTPVKLKSGSEYYNEEQITFDKSKEGSIQDEPIENTPHNRYEWCSSGPDPVFSDDGKDITLPEEAIAYLGVNYYTLSDLWALKVDKLTSCDGYFNGTPGWVKIMLVAHQEENDVKASTEVEFGDSDTDSDSGLSISVALDEAKNEAVYGEDKSTFYYGEDVFLKVFGPKTIIGCTNWEKGTLTRVSDNINYDQVEVQTLVNTKEASLSALPSGSVHYTWIGKNPNVAVSFDGQTIKFSEHIFCAKVKFEYSAVGERWKANLPEDPTPNDDEAATDMLCAFATTADEEISASIEVTFDTKLEDVEYEIVIVDFCTDEPVQGAYIEGGIDRLVGSVTSDSNGVVYKGIVSPGNYSVGNITKSGYVPSHSDPIENEQISVQAETEEAEEEPAV